MQTILRVLFAVALFSTLLSCSSENSSDDDPYSQGSEDFDSGLGETDEPAEDESGLLSVEVGRVDQPAPELGDIGCSCSFRSDSTDYNATILLGNMNGTAQMVLDGEAAILGGGETDSNHTYIEKSQQKDWIEMYEPIKGYVFGKEIPFGTETWTTMLKEELIHALIMMETLPERIDIKTHGTVTMGIRGNVGDVTIEAIDFVKNARAEAEAMFPYTFHYSNERYVVDITALKTGVNDGGGLQFDGELQIRSHEGKILKTMRVWGSCGC